MIVIVVCRVSSYPMRLNVPDRGTKQSGCGPCTRTTAPRRSFFFACSVASPRLHLRYSPCTHILTYSLTHPHEHPPTRSPSRAPTPTHALTLTCTNTHQHALTLILIPPTPTHSPSPHPHPPPRTGVDAHGRRPRHRLQARRKRALREHTQRQNVGAAVTPSPLMISFAHPHHAHHPSHPPTAHTGTIPSTRTVICVTACALCGHHFAPGCVCSQRWDVGNAKTAGEITGSARLVLVLVLV